MKLLSREKWRRTRRRLVWAVQDTLWRIGRSIYSFFWFLTWPVHGGWRIFLEGWKRARTRNLLFGLPAIIALVGTGILWQAARVNARSLDSEYLKIARTALQKEEYAAAEIYLQRVLRQTQTGKNQAEFELGEVFEKTNRQQRAQSLFERLAPDETRGYAPAHRKRAVWLADQINSKSDNDEIRRLRWHLTHADGQRTPVLARAWATYYLALNQVEPAITRLEQAVSEFPELSLLLGNLYLGSQQMEQAKRSYMNASEFLRDRVDKDPQNRTTRVAFANTLLKLGELDECQAVLEIGLKLDPEGPYKQLLASLYTNRHDGLARQGGVPISVLLSQLRIALTYDPTFTPAYERLVSYGNANVEGEANLGDILVDVIARGEEPGLAHFAMSILKWKEEDIEATRWHLERAYRLLPDMPFVANNLAWILATEEPADVNKAYEIINPAVEIYPNEPRLLDTRGTILMKLERWTDALDDLERALQYQRQPALASELHEKLAVVCDQLNQPKLAEQHRKLALTAGRLPESQLPKANDKTTPATNEPE